MRYNIKVSNPRNGGSYSFDIPTTPEGAIIAIQNEVQYIGQGVGANVLDKIKGQVRFEGGTITTYMGDWVFAARPA